MDKQQMERDACANLKGKGLSRKEIAERLGLTERQVKRRLSAGGNGDVNRTKFGRGIVADIAYATITSSKIAAASTTASSLGLEQEYFANGEPDFSFPLSKDKNLYRFEKGDKKRDDLKNYIEGKYRGQAVKILYLADLHIPFTMYEEVVEICKQHADADIVVINGDLLDLFAVSKFAKDKEVALRRELQEGREFLEFLSKRYKDVVVTEGNHERRLKSFIKAVIPVDMQFLFPDDCLQMIQSGEVLEKEPLKNVHIVGSWWIKLFDTIFAHPDNYSNATLKTVQNTSEFFSIIKGISHKACIIGHTHRAGKIVSGEVLLMETGCLCHDMDYHNGSNFTRTRWTRAYAVIQIDSDGTPDFNETDVVFVG
jgi:predicted phosphodiesterase